MSIARRDLREVSALALLRAAAVSGRVQAQSISESRMIDCWSAWLRARMMDAARAKARRSKLRISELIGYIWRPEKVGSARHLLA